MESSTVLAFRIFVMLSCLIIVPMAAIFGSAFPDVVKSVLVDRIVAWSTGQPIDSTRADSSTDGFREVTRGTVATAAPNNSPSQAPPWEPGDRDVASWQAPGAAPRDPAVVPLSQAGAGQGFNQSASFSAPSTPPTTYPPTQDAQPAPSNSPYHRRAVGQPPIVPAAPQAAANAASALGQPERFTEMQRRLREYGAAYYLLETWGKDGQMYRFHCRMAVTDNPNLTRHFEATSGDPLAAMWQVLEQVEAWRAGRSP